jgi:hypothetical protein
MGQHVTVASKILAYEQDPRRKQELQKFCQDHSLKGIFIANAFRLIDTLEHKINVGAIIVSDEGEMTRDLISELNTRHPEIPIFVGCETPELMPYQSNNEVSVVRCFKDGELETLAELLSAQLFYRIYPPGLVEAIQQIAREGIGSTFRGIRISAEDTFLASDKRVYGERFELIPIRSNWCEGVMMMQSDGEDVDDMIRAGRTSFPDDSHDVTRYSEDLLRELLNLIWGGFKARFVPPEFTGRPTNIEVPMSINYRNRYISFGVADPLLCFKFTIENDDESRPGFKPFDLFLKFSFHLHWEPDVFYESAATQQLVESGELEFF